MRSDLLIGITVSFEPMFAVTDAQAATRLRPERRANDDRPHLVVFEKHAEMFVVPGQQFDLGRVRGLAAIRLW